MEGEFPEHMKCPICLEIPQKEIFQCKNGHIHCLSCSTKLTSCPQCRADLGKHDKIRNRALEELLDSMKFHCIYKSKGCPEKSSRTDVSNHSEKCAYGGISAGLCSSLGFDCNFVTNTRTIENSLAHLIEFHQINSYSGNNLHFRFKSFSTLLPKANCKWKVILLTLDKVNLIIVLHLKDDFLSVNCLSLQEISKDYFVEFSFEDMSKTGFDIKWRTNPIWFTKATQILRRPMHSSSAELLCESYIQNTDLILHMRVITETFSVSNQKIQWVDVYASLSLNYGMKEIRSNYYPALQEKCKYCNKSLENQEVYACLECPISIGRFICIDCMSTSCVGRDTNHVLALLSNGAQVANFRMANFHNLQEYIKKYFGVNKTDRYKIDLLLRRKENVVLCTHCGDKPDFVCLSCNIKEGKTYCSKCFYLYKTGEHDYSHIYALAKTKYARITVISFLKDKGLFFEAKTASKRQPSQPRKCVATSSNNQGM